MNLKSQRPFRVMVLVQHDLIPPDTLEGKSQNEIGRWKTEYDVVSTLKSMGHDVRPVGIYNNLNVISEAIEEFKPDVAFNLIEEFDGYPLFDQHVVSYLELKRQSYTGCNPRGLTLARDKVLTKKILAFHRIHVPEFAFFPRNRKVRRPTRLKFPLLVKSAFVEGSAGIAQASIVRDDEKLVERVEFIHRQTNSPAIAEQYIEGREIYLGLIGNHRVQTYTPWELIMEKLPEGAANIATSKVKWSARYQEKVGLVTKAAELSPEQKRELEHLSRRIYRLMMLSGYARLDYRLTEDGKFFLLEANPNPNIANKDDFADSAEASGVTYPQLLRKVMTLGMRYDPMQ
jgi:D-alanine-D-alanine ligase